MEDLGIYAFAGIVMLLLAFMAISVARHGGWRGALFGARVLRELGEVGGQRGLFNRRLRAKVYLLEGDGDAPRVGLELTNGGKRSYATLGAADARRLAELLMAAGR